ncbi:MAG: PadR family transcriptional regulator [Ardenticatenaceae bacterium]|nr:PadR family transcriptional regulator [Ardenticatenaceae bacterium]
MLNKDLVAASSTSIVLSILAKGESYGYDIIQQIRDLSDEQMIWSDGMLYPLLHRLENKGLIVSEWRRSESGRRRKYYRINDEGHTALQQEKAQWQIVNSTLHKLWGVSHA